MEDQKWHLVTTTYDGQNMCLYLDSYLVATNTSAVTMTDTAPYSLVFGARSDGSRGEDILIDQIQFYNRAISKQEVAVLFAGDTQDFTATFMADVAISNGHWNAQFSGVPGAYYRLEYKDYLTSSNDWQVVTDIVSMATSPAEVSAPMTSSTGFYRVLWVP